MGVSPRGLAVQLKIASCECSPICGFFFPLSVGGFLAVFDHLRQSRGLKGGAGWECLGYPAVLGLLLEHRHHGRSL